MSNNVLSLENITMQFGGVVAVSDLNLQVNRGEIVALIGPNGAGKTTAFNVISGVYAPTNGRVTFLGQTIAENHPQGKMKKLYDAGHAGEYTKVVRNTPDKITKNGIARTFQNIRLFKDMTVLENVLVAKHMKLKAGLLAATFRLNLSEERRITDECMELLKIVDLDGLSGEKSSSLPYGKQRHLEIARALATAPKLLMLDEPAAGMNPKETEELSEFVVKIKDDFGLTVFLIEHHMDLVMQISDRIYVVDFGKLIASGTADQVQDNPDVIAAYLGVDD